MNNKRQIKGTEYNVVELVQNAIATVDSKPLKMERNAAILKRIGEVTGLYGFIEKQIDNIDFSSTDAIVAGINEYLSRRNQAHRARWTASHR